MVAKFKACIYVMEKLVKGVSHRTFQIARLSFQYSLLNFWQRSFTFNSNKSPT